MNASERRPARLQRWLVAISTACARSPRFVCAAAAVLLVAAVFYDWQHFAIDTNGARLISASVPWRQREIVFDAAFPERMDLIAIVVDGTTPDVAERASALLADRLALRQDLFKSVRRPDSGPFWARNGLLFLPVDQVRKTTEQLLAAQPLLGTLAADPSVRGLMQSLQLALEGVRRGDATLPTLQPALAALAHTAEGVLADRPALLSWRSLLGAGPADPRELRRFVLVQPRLDYSAVQPGLAATGFIRTTARDAGLDAEHGVRVRLTGEVPMADEEIATLGEHAGRNAVVMAAGLLVMLWLAVRSLRAVLAIVVCQVVGLALSAALGLFVYGSFNLISIAFAVLFVGLGVDFGIQYVVSYRANRQAGRGDAVGHARAAALEVGASLVLAAVAIAAGFFAFAPTDYRGVSELGVVAGSGMLIALAASLSLLPALLVWLGVGGSEGAMTMPALGAVDAWLASRRRPVLTGAALVAVASLASLPWLRFDFNPMHLRSPNSEAVATLADLATDPQTSPDTVSVLAPSLAAAEALAARLAALPEVAQALTLMSFVPEDQATKLETIADAAMLLDVTLAPATVKPAPTDDDDVQAMRAVANGLSAAAAAAPGPAAAPSPVAVPGPAAAEAARLAKALEALANGPEARRLAFRAAVVPGLVTTLAQVNDSLHAGPVSMETLPVELRRDWVAADGRARVEVSPRGPGTATAPGAAEDDNDRLRRFVAAIRTLAPDAGGAPVSIQESAQTVIGAFVRAGVLALVAVTALLVVVLRRAADVLRTLASLLLGGLVTLGLCAVFGIALNYENIIALPLLFGIGVAFNIYFVIAWRRGRSDLLQSSLARAVIFSALTTATAFGSLWLSSHPGTASMGELLALSLACTLAAALLVLPALLGPGATAAAR